MEIVGAVFIANLIASFALLWRKAGVLKTIAVVSSVMLVSILLLTYIFHDIHPAPSAARNAAFQGWFVSGGLATFAGPVIGTLLAWYSRRRFAQFRAIAGGKPYGK